MLKVRTQLDHHVPKLILALPMSKRLAQFFFLSHLATKQFLTRCFFLYFSLSANPNIQFLQRVRLTQEVRERHQETTLKLRIERVFKKREREKGRESQREIDRERERAKPYVQEKPMIGALTENWLKGLLHCVPAKISPDRPFCHSRRMDFCEVMEIMECLPETQIWHFCGRSLFFFAKVGENRDFRFRGVPGSSLLLVLKIH